MKGKYPVIIFVVAILFAVTALSKQGVAANITVNQTADKITITGGKGKKIASDKFALNKDGWYIIKTSYTGADVSVCQLSLVTQTMITNKQTIGGLLTNWIGPNTTEKIQHKGSVKSEDYMIYVEDAGGPWTAEILKSPKPTPISSNTTFTGTTNKVTPFFHLKKGSAKFTMHQKLKGKFSSRLEIDLINADTGAFVSYLCHNAIEPTQTAKADIPAAGTYILEVSGGDNWDVSYAQ
ncbi:MAG: hypothetical protein ABSA44_14555 [Bacteroidota bacterium]|jgi:hypothetical protein